MLKSCWLNPSELFRILNSKKNYIRFFRHISGGVKNDSILLENFLEVVDKNIYKIAWNDIITYLNKAEISDIHSLSILKKFIKFYRF